VDTTPVEVTGVPNVRKKNLRELRKERGKTQFDMAIVIGVSTLSIQMWERKVSRPSSVYRKRLEVFFGMSADDMDLAPVKPGRISKYDLPVDQRG
jgi:transcriptional regulator with XRE-family HTH domain